LLYGVHNMFGVSDIAEAVAMRKDRFIKRYTPYVPNISIVCEICIYCYCQV